ncbi:MAG: hypothetical protein CMM62_01550 [Rhodospirillaceae bacterium]|nr:hypothetical protein [Rhodospirillaceae bacterium]
MRAFVRFSIGVAIIINQHTPHHAQHRTCGSGWRGQVQLVIAKRNDQRQPPCRGIIAQILNGQSPTGLLDTLHNATGRGPVIEGPCTTGPYLSQDRPQFGLAEHIAFADQPARWGENSPRSSLPI